MVISISCTGGAASTASFQTQLQRLEMDDLYAINAAKTEFREGFNAGDAARILAIADPELVSFSDGQPSEFGKSGLEALEIRLKSLFERYAATLAVIVVEIRINGDIAHDYGWHEVTLTPKDGGQPIHLRNRYVDIWRRNKEGHWMLWMYMDNPDVPDPFRPREIRSARHEVTGAA
jgi:ketosteroid isomerase-like protein